MPTTFRAADFTALTARNGLGVFFFGTGRLLFDRKRDSAIQSQRSPRTPMEERDFFEERAQTKPQTLTCPHCHQSAEYELGWLVRTKKKSLPPRADDRDRAKFAKARSYMVRKDDLVGCKNVRCRKRFEIASVQSVVFLD